MEKGKDSWTVRDTVNGLPLNPGTYTWKLKGKYEVEKMYWDGWSWHKESATNESNTSNGSWSIEYKNVPNPLSVSFNKKNFKSNEELVVTVQREDIFSAYLYLGSKFVARGYVDDSDEIVLSSDFSDLDFSESKHWYGEVSIYLSYVSPLGYFRWTTYDDQYINVEKVYTSSQATAPDRPKSFHLAQGLYRGQIRLTWTKSNSDGGSAITDYQYQLSYYRSSSNSWMAWPDDDDWESAGTDMTELISGLRSRTKYRVRMRTKNNVDPSVITGYKTVTTR